MQEIDIDGQIYQISERSFEKIKVGLNKEKRERSIPVKKREFKRAAGVKEVWSIDDGIGKYHRDKGPAVIWWDGTEEYYFNGSRHREDGPAIIKANGFEEYWLNDKKLSKEDFLKRVEQFKKHKIKIEDDIFEVESWIALSLKSSLKGDC